MKSQLRLWWVASLMMVAFSFSCATTADPVEETDESVTQEVPEEPEEEAVTDLDPDPEIQAVPDEVLRSGAWVEANKKDPSVVLIHVGNDRESWEQSHISGQAYVEFMDIVVGGFEEGFLLPPLDELRATFEEAGVGDNSQVILTGDLEGLMATRAFLSLEVLGLAGNVALLDGGLEQWRDDQRPVTSEPYTITAGEITTEPRLELIVDADVVQEHIDDIGVELVDARPPAEYSGEVAGPGVERAGHIPSAINVFWKSGLQLEDRPLIQEREELRDTYGRAGVVEDAAIIAYCRTGVQASFGYFLARHLDRDVVVYDGSFVDWSNDPDREVEK